MKTVKKERLKALKFISYAILTFMLMIFIGYQSNETLLKNTDNASLEGEFVDRYTYNGDNKTVELKLEYGDVHDVTNVNQGVYDVKKGEKRWFSHKAYSPNFASLWLLLPIAALAIASFINWMESER